MIFNESIPLRARCLSCGYLLRDLPTPVCPECGRAFDPGDPTTYDADPPTMRRRTWIKRGVVALVVVALAFVFSPRGLLRSSMTFTCTQCGQKLEVRRWELKPPRWIPFRYPGLHRSTKTPTARSYRCATHLERVQVRSDMATGGWISGTGRAQTGTVILFNDMAATPETAAGVLKALTAPTNNGITVDSRPLRRTPAPLGPEDTRGPLIPRP